MGNDVLKMMETILNEFYNDEEKTKQIISQLEKEKRIITELWG